MGGSIIPVYKIIKEQMGLREGRLGFCKGRPKQKVNEGVGVLRISAHLKFKCDV